MSIQTSQGLPSETLQIQINNVEGYIEAEEATWAARPTSEEFEISSEIVA
jgi:hypothetical protein